ncbi:MAG: hypothetical protein QXS02_04770 [Candidatus Thermoplasmatota archaeon]
MRRLLLVVLFLFMLGLNPAFQCYQYRYHIHYDDALFSSNETIMISTAGPVNRLITMIEFSNESSPEVDRIRRIIDSRILHLLVPLLVIPVEHIDFNVSYNIHVLLRRSPLSYYTAVTSYKNGSIYNSTCIINQPHSIKVKNFGGVFLFTRSKPFNPFRYTAAKYQLIGGCEEVQIAVT